MSIKPTLTIRERRARRRQSEFADRGPRRAALCFKTTTSSRSSRASIANAFPNASSTPSAPAPTACLEVHEPRRAEVDEDDASSSRSARSTDMFIRFSTVAASRGGPDVARDPRGFAMKFYTEDGNWDLVGNNTPVFFIRDGIKFPDFIHSQKQDPYTNRAGSRTTCGTSSRTRPRRRTSSRGSSATAAFPRRTAAWTASARTPSSG